MKKLNLFLMLVIFATFASISEIKAQDKGNDELIKVETSLVNVPVIVSDHQSRYIAGLKAKDFTIYQDGKPQKIEFFASEEAPINVAILLDTSRSTEQVLDEIQDAAIQFIQKLRPNDRAMIVSFDRDVNILSHLTSNKKELEDAINSADIGERGGTVLNDAVSEVVNKELGAIKGRKAIILLTDGKDVGSEVTKEDLSNQLVESDTMIYSVYFQTGGMNNRRARFDDRNDDRRRGDDRYNDRRRDDDRYNDRQGNNGGYNDRRGDDDGYYRRRRDDNQRNDDRQDDRQMNGRRGGMQNDRSQRQSVKNQEAFTFLQSMSDMTAGRLFQNDQSDFNNIFTSIADELRKQYLIGYYPDGADDQTAVDKVYQIKVKVDRNDAVVRAKNTYRKKSEVGPTTPNSAGTQPF